MAGKHSPLGASGAERWMACPGSVALLRELKISDTSDEPDWTKDGTCAHAVAAKCLEEKMDAWEFIGSEVEGVKVTEEIISGVQVYLDHVRPLMVKHGRTYIEFPIQFKQHKDGFGTVDFATVADSLMNIRDYKNGAGITVEAEENPQLMYYAFGVLQLHDDVRRVVIGIVQPNAFHVEGPIRKWSTTADFIHEWANDILIPAMHRTEIDHSLDAGPWCRFCPAKLICPQMTSLFGAACQANHKEIVNISNESLGRSYQYIAAVKSYLKALQEETFRRANKGETVPGTKLVYKKSHRVWKSGAKEALAEVYPAEMIFEPATFKSPAEIEKIGPDAKELTKEWAFKPQSGLTIALESDPQPGVKVQSTTEAFGAAVANLNSEEF